MWRLWLIWAMVLRDGRGSLKADNANIENWKPASNVDCCQHKIGKWVRRQIFVFAPTTSKSIFAGVGGKDDHILSKSRGRIFVIAGSSFAPNPYCWDRRRKIITFAVPYVNKKQNSIESLINIMTRLCWFWDRVTFLTSWCFFCDHVYSIILVTPGSPPAFVPGNASDPLLPHPPLSIPKHPTLFVTFGLLHFSHSRLTQDQSSRARLTVRITYSWYRYELGKVRHEPDKCIITIWPQLYP